MNKDLTSGNPQSVLWRFCMPLFGSIIFQQLYNIADSFVAGKFVGENALAAVGNSYEITLIFIAFAFGCNMGCSVVVSKLFGAKNYKGMKTAVYTACIFSALVCAALMIIGITSSSALLRLIRTPDEVFADSELYLDIYPRRARNLHLLKHTVHLINIHLFHRLVQLHRNMDISLRLLQFFPFFHLN